MDIIEQAIDFEYNGHKFYTEQAALAKTTAVRDILKNLASDELEHAEFLEFLQKNQVDEFKPSDSMHKIKDIIKESIITDPKFLSKDLAVLDVLKAALELEDKARKHYSDEALSTLDEKSQKLLSLLALEEEKHYNLIANLIKFIDEPGNLLETQEFSHYD